MMGADLSLLRQAFLLHTLEDGHITEFYRRAEAAIYIGSVSVCTGAGLDVQATAEKIGVPVEYDAALRADGRYVPPITGEAGPAPRVILRPGREDMRLAFAHEIGHHFLDAELGVGHQLVGTMHEPVSEAFCEYFGRCMADPLQAADEALEQEVKALYHVPADYGQYVMEQLLRR